MFSHFLAHSVLNMLVFAFVGLRVWMNDGSTSNIE